MPSTVVEICRNYSEAEEVALLDVVHEALVRAFRIPPEDRHLRLVAHEPHRFARPPGKAQPDRCTMISIDAFAGRSLDAKRALYREIVEGLEPLGIPPDHVTMIVRDLPLESWGINGGIAATDVDLGFDVNV